jgi:twitching motility two-component system response regulator PilH
MLNFGPQRKLPTLLLIDDDLISREVTATLLTMNDYSVHTAADGAAALRMLDGEKCTPEVILMDAQMPGLSGAQLIAELRTHTKAAVYVVSGSNPPKDVTDAADGFLLKPFDAQALTKLLDNRKGQVVSTPAQPEPEEPVVSASTLAKFRDVMPEASVREIYSAVVTDLARRLHDLEVAIAKNDAAEVHRIGHAIKGGCGMAGALQAARIGALLETAPLDAEGNFLDNSDRLLLDLRAAARSLERMLNSGLQA